ncbi:hypothetical protein AB1Y20_020176 [Prymnesium parvum]|uniref:Uncharacterized protein n=1 Tax=Prymnesium parvum TaxID=97485 RepID=A0AB34JTY0_PRYPA
MLPLALLQCAMPRTSTPPPAFRTDATMQLAGQTAHVSAEYLSFTLDASSWRSLDLNGSYSSALDVLAAALRPARLRVGGTQADYDVYSGFGPGSTSCAQLRPPMSSYRCREVNPAQLRSLLNFTQRNGLSLIFGLNDLFGRPTKTSPEKDLCSESACPARNLTNAAALVRWAAAEPLATQALYALELGNELNSCLRGSAGARAQAADLNALKTLVDAAWREGAPRVLGPDTHSSLEFEPSALEWFTTYAAEASAAAGLTYHEYSLGDGPKLDPQRLDESFLSPSQLDRAGQGAKNLRAALKTLPDAPPLWVGESAAANNGGQSGITDTFVDVFWYLDQLGSLAALNVSVFLRQTLLSRGGYPLIELSHTEGEPSRPTVTPLPDYWVALLHKRLMGERVLNTTSSARNVRLYAHCGKPGGVSVAFLNIADLEVTLTLPIVLARSPRVDFILTAGKPIEGAVDQLQSKEVLLNGELSLAHPL